MARADIIENVDPTEPKIEETPETIQDVLPTDLATDETDVLQVDSGDTGEIPEKYKGKSIKEIISMHQEAEKRLGTQGNEVGELRGIVDDYIRRQSEQQQVAEPAGEPLSADEYFEDPAQAVAKAVENHPAVRKAQQTAEEFRKQSAASALKERHPDAPQIVNSSEFAEFVKASPIRTELYIRADQESDFAAADELLSLFKERVQTAKTAADVETQARKRDLQRASTGSAKGSSQGTGKRIYRRREIIDLMRDHPEKYERYADDIAQAYAEGRVR